MFTNKTLQDNFSMTRNNEKKLALFDFDGTITREDTYMEFFKFAFGRPRLYAGAILLFPWIALYFLHLVPAGRLKEIMISHFFKNRDAGEFARMAEEFALGKMSACVKDSALARIAWHKEQGHEVAVVSASLTHWLAPWCRKYNLELIATELEVKDNRITGKLATPNCNGPEKVNRIRQRFHLDSYIYIYAYGNSSGDKPMLALSHEPYYNNFK